MPVAVLLDTNVWVSAFLNPSGPPARVRHAWYADRYQVVISLPLLEELADVLARPRLTRKYSIVADDVKEFLQLLVERSTVVRWWIAGGGSGPHYAARRRRAV